MCIMVTRLPGADRVFEELLDQLMWRIKARRGLLVRYPWDYLLRSQDNEIITRTTCSALAMA